jgi:FkbM family methyltransferase
MSSHHLLDVPSDDLAERHYSFLDALVPSFHDVGHGRLGFGGDLGYEAKRVRVRGRQYAHAISAHAPSRLVYDLENQFTDLDLAVAINDDIETATSVCVDFEVFVDGQLACYVRNVTAGMSPVPVSIDLTDARTLELTAVASRRANAHSVWLDPKLTHARYAGTPLLHDALGMLEFSRVPILVPRQQYLVIAASRGNEPELEELLFTIRRNGSNNLGIALLVIDDAPDVETLAIEYLADVIHCRHVGSVQSAMDVVLYSAARFVPGEKLLCMNVNEPPPRNPEQLLDDLDVCRRDEVVVSAISDAYRFRNLGHALGSRYSASLRDIALLTRKMTKVADSCLMANSRLFAGRRKALLAIEQWMRRSRSARQWLQQAPKSGRASELLFNVALASLGVGRLIERSNDTSESLPRRSPVSHSCINASMPVSQSPTWPNPRQQVNYFLESIVEPKGLAGRGIVTAAGGECLQLNAYVTFRLLRTLGCNLPVRCYYAGAAERSDRFANLIRPLAIDYIDAVSEGFIGHPIAMGTTYRGHEYHPQWMHGYTLKAWAAAHAPFRHLLWLDADCHFQRTPELLFDSAEYRERGAVFFREPANANHPPDWSCLGLKPVPGEELGWETGCFAVDKLQHNVPLQLAYWFCQTGHEWFKSSFGDKDCYNGAFHYTRHAYWLAPAPSWRENAAILHDAPDGKRLLWHRAGTSGKLRLDAADPLPDFPLASLVCEATKEFNGCMREEYVMVELDFGRLFVPTIDQDVGLFVRKHGSWEADTTAYFRRVIKPGMAVIDIGANIGYFTLLLSKLVGELGRVLAFEPLAECVQGIRRCQLSNVVVHAIALGDRAGHRHLSIHPLKLGVATFRQPHDWVPAETRSVKCARLDDFEVPQCHLIKIDVEGDEFSVIRGATETISRHRPVLLVEFLPRHFETPAKYLEELHVLGSVHALCHDGETRPISDQELLADPNRLWMLEVVT